jgi:hypothetical protein
MREMVSESTGKPAQRCAVGRKRCGGQNEVASPVATSRRLGRLETLVNVTDDKQHRGEDTRAGHGDHEQNCQWHEAKDQPVRQEDDKP